MRVNCLNLFYVIIDYVKPELQPYRVVSNFVYTVPSVQQEGIRIIQWNVNFHKNAGS
jgi:hypothetical protein